jgi:hypothetical protein
MEDVAISISLDKPSRRCTNGRTHISDEEAASLISN